MAKVVNIKENLPVAMKVVTVKAFEKNGIPEDFIRALVTPLKNGLGVERDKHYILTTSALIHFQFPQYKMAFLKLRNLLDIAWLNNYQYIMLKKNEKENA